MGLKNPKVNNIDKAIKALSRTATKVVVTGTVEYPDWVGTNDHIQGIAPKNGTRSVEGVLSGSSADGGYLASYASSKVEATSIWPKRPEDYDHGGGAQMLGDYLAFAVESDRSEDNAKVAIYDLKTMSNPVLKYWFDCGYSKASAVAITNFTDGTTDRALLATYDYEPRRMRFFIAELSAVKGSTNPFKHIYTYKEAGGGVLAGDQFQNFALVTSTAEKIYLLGFREDEELHVFEVLYDSRESFKITGLRSDEVYKDWSGSDWRYGMGIQIISADEVNLWGTCSDPSGSRSEYTINLYRYA